MSADNWSVCPRCRDRAKAEKIARAQAAVDAYGKVSAEEYAALVERSTEPLEPKETFREDYEFYGASGGTVTASYSGHCDVCGLGVDFQYEHPFYVEGVDEDV